jgi:hypothetical protein
LVKRLLLILLLVLAPRLARADQGTKAPFSFPYFAGMFVGGGGVPLLPRPFVTTTAEIGQHPLTGALLSGLSVSSATSGNEWSVLTPGIFARIDLTYLFRSGFWTVEPTPSWIHFDLGARIGLGLSQSFQHIPLAKAESDYSLIRPELQSTFDCEMWPFASAPFPRARHYALVVRGALDNSVDLGQVLRWSLAMGLHYGWGGED